MNINDHTQQALWQLLETIGDAIDDPERTGEFIFNVEESSLRLDNDELIVTDSKTNNVWLIKITDKGVSK